jgi:hypothetical protein
MRLGTYLEVGYLWGKGTSTGYKDENGWKKTYNTEDSLVVTDTTTSPALASLTKGERTGSRIFLQVWSYVPAIHGDNIDAGRALDAILSRFGRAQSCLPAP